MGTSENILIQKDTVEKIQEKISELKASLKDKNHQSIIDEILELLENELRVKDIPLEDMIHDKMVETKFSDPELNFKLYMLYRKLTENKIRKEEALKIYEMYIF